MVKFSMIESGRLIHVDPQSIVLNFIIKVLETSGPHIHAFGVPPIHKYSYFWPHLSKQCVVILVTLIHA